MMEGLGRKIVIADDDRAVLELLHIRLNVAGFRAVSVRSGAEAIRAVAQAEPSAMIIDRSLQDTDAFEVLRQFNARGRRPRFPILLTGRVLTELEVRYAARLGARECMIKPFSGSDALERLDRTLKMARERASTARVWD
jgi:DNA-binding response OmpR family regulator